MSEPAPEPISRTYRFVMAVCAPILRAWGRLEAVGTENLPRGGPVVLIGNHAVSYTHLTLPTNREV